ncbi:MurR/RpiR family transcriptional regulator [Lentibacillus sediminis]|uniref:MurR/RpiR family transcriptional regulator n=1 Tax=Lentibacillus sediminis TaxID=1940529 RepID=UPI000C1C32ED|nr:MurR/RpiR family transcriptional regulator [Lentibacillus sediminis]
MRMEERARKYEYKLNDTDDQIIEFILEHKQDVQKMSIQHLADQLYTVPNTIMRLSRKLGYDGFSHLKSSLKDEQSEQSQVQNSSYFYIQKTFDLMDEEIILTVCRWMEEARHVLFYGVGDNSDVCKLMVRNLRVVSKGSDYFSHRHEILHAVEEMGEKDVLFLISLSGKTPQVLEIAERAHARGIRIVSLTHFQKNPLQQLASLPLYCYSPKKELNGYNITDHTPVMIVLQALSQYYWDHIGSM